MGILRNLTIKRKHVSEFQCSNCGASVSPESTECTSCGSRLITQCSNCHCMVEMGWTECHICGKKLPENFGQLVRVDKPKKSKGALIGIVAVLIVAIFAGGVILFCADNDYSEEVVTDIQGMYNICVKDFRANDTIKKWVQNCDKTDGKVFALVSENMRVCILYIKDATKIMNSNMDYYYSESEDWCKAKIQINEEEYNDVYGYKFFMYMFDVYDDFEMEVEFAGAMTDVDITYTDADIRYETWGGVTLD